MALISQLLENPYTLQSVLVAAALVVLSAFYKDLTHGLPHKNIPVVGRGLWELSNKKAKDRFVSSARDLISQGFDQGRTMFQLMASFNPMIVLHPQYINEVKSHPDLRFDEANRKAFFADYPGFEPFDGRGKERTIILDLINKKLTQSLGPLAIPLSREAADTLKDGFGQPTDWESHKFAQDIPYLVARLSSLIFLGPKICHDKEWINVSVNYTIDAFLAARALNMWPVILQPLAHVFHPRARAVRGHVRVARQVIQKELKRREMVRAGELEDPIAAERHSDALEWMQELAAGHPIDIAARQIGLSLAAIHTTSNLITNVIYDLAAYPEYVQPLRDEIKAVMEEDGELKKTSLTKMKLMDSVLKETQRVNPVSLAVIHRYTAKDVQLSDGKKIPKGANMVVSTHEMRDESIWEDAKTYNGYRFYNKRQEPGHENKHQLVMTSKEHIGFGYGVHACPGRFFASNEIKILLVHLLMKYDFKFEEETTRPKSFELGTEIVCNPNVKVLFKAREPEIDLRSLGE